MNAVEISQQLVDASLYQMIQTGAIGVVLMCLLAYTVWNQKEIIKERKDNAIAKEKSEQSVAKERERAQDQIIAVLNKTNDVDAEGSKNISMLTKDVDALIKMFEAERKFLIELVQKNNEVMATLQTTMVELSIYIRQNR